MESVDLYEDLGDCDLGQQVQKLQEQNSNLTCHIEALENDVEKLCKEITEMKKVQENLKRNITELYKTAKAEIDRRDRVISELRAELESIKNRLRPAKPPQGIKSDQHNKTARNPSKDVPALRVVRDRVPHSVPSKISTHNKPETKTLNPYQVLDNEDEFKPNTRRYQNLHPETKPGSPAPVESSRNRDHVKRLRRSESRERSPRDYGRKRSKHEEKERYRNTSSERRHSSSSSHNSKRLLPEKRREYNNSGSERNTSRYHEDDRNRRAATSTSRCHDNENRAIQNEAKYNADRFKADSTSTSKAIKETETKRSDKHCSKERTFSTEETKQDDASLVLQLPRNKDIKSESVQNHTKTSNNAINTPQTNIENPISPEFQDNIIEVAAKQLSEREEGEISEDSPCSKKYMNQFQSVKEKFPHFINDVEQDYHVKDLRENERANPPEPDTKKFHCFNLNNDNNVEKPVESKFESSEAEITSKVLGLSEFSILSSTENFHLAQLSKQNEIPTLHIEDVNRSLLEKNSKPTEILGVENLQLFSENANPVQTSQVQVHKETIVMNPSNTKQENDVDNLNSQNQSEVESDAIKAAITKPTDTGSKTDAIPASQQDSKNISSSSASNEALKTPISVTIVSNSQGQTSSQNVRKRRRVIMRMAEN